MARYVNDQSKILILYESGLYGSPSGTNGTWIGEVFDNQITDAENKIETRYLGANTRSFVNMVPGPRDVTGTIMYYPQDMRLLSLMIGSNYDEGLVGGNYAHIATQIQTNVVQSPFTSGPNNMLAPISFTLEDSKTVVTSNQNFIRTINGMIPDKLTLTGKNKAKFEIAIDYVGQTLVPSSGATTSVTASLNTAYLWNNAKLTVSGTILDTTTDLKLIINQNLAKPHYLNGSRDIGVPFPQYRENTLDITMDLDSTEANLIYQGLYKTNSQFDSTLDINADSSAGSQHTILFLSGGRITKMMNPSVLKGPTISTVTINVPIVVGSFFDNIPKYSAW